METIENQGHQLDTISNSKNPLRAAVLAAILSVLAPQVAKAELPDCHDVHSRPVSAESIWLENGQEAEVVCVVDGDTFDARLDDGRLVRIRIWGVDCPESTENEKCMRKGDASCESEVKRGRQAKELTRMKLEGKRVKVEGPFKNNGERKLSYVRVQGEDLSLWLISSCKCKADYQHKRKKDYEKVEKKACGK